MPNQERAHNMRWLLQNSRMPNHMNGIGSGTNLYQKPMPKQDKEGGINPAFDFRARPSKQRSGAANFVTPLLTFS